MPRVKSGVVSHRRMRKVLRRANGFYGGKHRLYRSAKEALMRAGQYAYRDRKVRKRDFRSLWITRINAAARIHGITYSQLINGLKKANVGVDRKILADLAVNDDATFSQLASVAQQQISA
jgi:large subunit ribosomal protein L20